MIYPLLPSGKLTWQWNMDHFKMYFLLEMVIFHCHVSLLEGMLLVTHPHLPTSVGRSLMLFSKLTACHAVPGVVLDSWEEQKKDPFFRETFWVTNVQSIFLSHGDFTVMNPINFRTKIRENSVLKTRRWHSMKYLLVDRDRDRRDAIS